MKPKLLAVSTLLIGILAVGCTQPSGNSPSAASVVNIDDDDPEMTAAISKAKETLPFFEKNWKIMQSDGYSLKFALPTSDGDLEHIWFSPTLIDGNRFTGNCANDPAKIPGLSFGDARTVDHKDVSDWMILVDRKCYGGYTIRVLATRDPSVAPPLEFLDPPSL